MANRNALIIISALYLSCASLVVSADPTCKSVGSDWMWFGDHAVTSIKYNIAIEYGKKVEVGTGIMILKKPRGSIKTMQNIDEVVALGIGAIHVRHKDSGQAKVCIDSKSPVSITIIDENF
ncbi:MAG: hypothetical protein JKY81_02120 [Colwellia sp.]|nr:hypothetical protein [Colwellia sp.]